jgi:RNA polymerase sigma-70 factor (ECF subfamily)
MRISFIGFPSAYFGSLQGFWGIDGEGLQEKRLVQPNHRIVRLSRVPTMDLENESPRNFESTRWSLVFRAGEEGEEAERALGILCQTYWYPLYGYARRRGCAPHDAQDLVQGFLAKIIVLNLFASADREKGRLRSYLLRAFQHYIRDERVKANAEKRGGGAPLVSIDVDWAEQCFVAEPSDEKTPDQAYDREWAMAILNNALARLREEWCEKGKGETFDLLRPCLSLDEEAGSNRELAIALGVSESNAKVTVHRLRSRYRELVQKEIERTLPADHSVDDELQYLYDVLRS